MTHTTGMQICDPQGHRLYLTGSERTAFRHAAEAAPREVRTCNGLCDLQGLMRLGSRTIKHVQGFFTSNNATGNILCCDWDDFHTD